MINVRIPLLFVKVIVPRGIRAAAIRPNELALIQSNKREKFFDFLILGINGLRIRTNINEGKKICQEVGVFNLPLDLIKEIGKFKFRFSFGQNLAKHTVEVTKIATAVAYELKANVNIVKMGALLHDIGKIVCDQEGTHVDLGVDLLRKYKISEKVIDCVAEHHEGKEFSSVESVIVYIGDAVDKQKAFLRENSLTSNIDHQQFFELNISSQLQFSALIKFA
jgi:putative nucleotidyltransferase with HDIG domain